MIENLLGGTSIDWVFLKTLHLIGSEKNGGVIRDDVCTHLPQQLSAEALFSSRSPLFYMSKLAENCMKKTSKRMRGPELESYIISNFSLFLLGLSF